MSSEDIIDKLTAIVCKILPSDTELVDLQLKGSGNKSILRILVDKVTGGIGLDECACINREVSERLDEFDLFKSKYILDVSSPGIDYSFKNTRDFMRNLNRVIKINTNENEVLVGKLVKVNDDSITIESEDITKDVLIKDIKAAKQKI